MDLLNNPGEDTMKSQVEVWEDTSNPIVQAVAPLKNDAIARAEEEANKMVAHIAKKLEEAGWDLDVAAPYPKSAWSVSREQYILQVSKHKLYGSVVKHRASSRRFSDPDFVDMHQPYIDRFIEQAKKDAAFQYDAFVAKLVKKIGETTEATLTGNHVWGHSILHVILVDGTKQNWKTQQIVNVSKLGKLFNQWPTRKQK
jgi:hypothetical protein